MRDNPFADNLAEQTPLIDLGEGGGGSGTDTVGDRADGLRLIGGGLGAYAIGFVGLWLSFEFAGAARTILGAGPLFGGGMMAAGIVKVVFGRRLGWLRVVAAVLGALIGLASAVILLEELFGIVLDV